MPYKIVTKRKTLRDATRMPQPMQARFALLLEDLRDSGPLQPGWPNFSGLGKDCYHCHLGHKWVACWRWEKDTIVIEVYYAGSRENAPY